MTRLLHPDAKDFTLDALLHALADPTRRRIVRALAAEKACSGKGMACNKAAPPDLPKSTLSNHYAVLRATGLARGERVGHTVVHTLRCEDWDSRFPGVLSTILAAEQGGGGR